jgi:hypothetical protein
MTKQANGELYPCPVCPGSFRKMGLAPHVRSQHPEYKGPIFAGRDRNVATAPAAPLSDTQRERVAETITQLIANPALALSAIDLRLEEEQKAMQKAEQEMAGCESRITALTRLKEQFAPEHIERAPRARPVSRDVA